MRGVSGLIALAALVLGGACSDDEAVEKASSGGGAGTSASGGSAGASVSGGTSGSGGGAGVPEAGATPVRVLLFSKTKGFRHDSIPAAITALEGEAPKRGWQVTATEDSQVLVQGLSSSDVVVFLNTSGDVLDDSEQSTFRSWMAMGRGWVGIHAASDTEYDWPWYGELVGAWFAYHPAIASATLRVERQRHLATEGLGATWKRSDEWYAFQQNPRAGVHVLLSLDEKSYDPGAVPMGDHPVSWTHAHGGGRAFYTALGHTSESWSEAAFLAHVAGGIDWAAGRTHPRQILEELDGLAPVGIWDAHAHPTGFSFDVTKDALVMYDQGQGSNQHVVRRGVSVDPGRPYVIEGAFTIAAEDPFGTEMNSFALNLNVAGPDGALAPPSTWSVNVDLPSQGPGGVMKYMGFVGGTFAALGQRSIGWGKKGTEYLLRAGVGLDVSGAPSPKKVTTTVLEAGVVREHYDVDYSTFPYQPEPGKPVRLGANTHATDWTLRGLRVFYAD